MTNEAAIPANVLTGYLGTGKTTLLNRILSEHEGLMKRRGRFDGILVETTGLADSAPVARPSS